MSADISNLMQHIHDYFLHLFHQSSTTFENTFLAFESVGIPITPDMFKLHPDDTNYSTSLAIEQFSILTNTIPEINADEFQHTGKTVEDFYNLIIQGAQHSAPGSAESNVFNILKSQAEQTFDQMKAGAMIGTYERLPTYAMPTTWYDPAVTADWTSYSFSSNSTAAGPPQDTASAKPPTVTINSTQRPWMWRVVPEKAKPILDAPQALRRMSSTEIVSRFGGTLISSRVPQNSTTADPVPQISGSQVVRRNISPTVVGKDIVLAQPFDRVATNRLQITINPNLLTSRAARQPIADVVKLAQLVETTSSKPVTSQDLTFSLQYCIVTITRPWLSQALLNAPGWVLPGYAAGSFSTGLPANNTGIFPALPIACIVVKDVHITAKWSGDAGDAQNAAAIGPFALVGRSIDRLSGTLTVGGMQIIGWICQVMPLIPPAVTST